MLFLQLSNAAFSLIPSGLSSLVARFYQVSQSGKMEDFVLDYVKMGSDFEKMAGRPSSPQGMFTAYDTSKASTHWRR
jgi:hypothetical protein